MIVEDGTGLTDANSYVSVSGADAYFAERGETKWSTFTASKKDNLLILATDYIDTAYRWRGKKATPEQALQFPRENCIDNDGFVREGVPLEVKKAVMECALLIGNDNEVYSVEDENGAVISEKIGDLAFTYETKDKMKESTRYDVLNLKVKGLVIDTGRGKVISSGVSRV